MPGVEPDNFLYRFTKLCTPIVNAAFLKRAHGIENVPKAGPLIIAANHVSFPDVWLIWNTIIRARNEPPWFIGRNDFWINTRWTKVIASRGGALFIDWRNPAAVLEQAMSILKRGGVVGVFPEGTRNMDPGALVLGKTGAARLALATAAPVVPIGYIGPKVTTTWEGFKHFVFKRNTAVINVGSPLRFASTPGPVAATRKLLHKTTDSIMIEIGKLCGKRARLHTL